ncbi:MAG: ABC transporter permease [Bacilli bacterium]|nr:ABC transporter permease [Bacilli bacterium]
MGKSKIIFKSLIKSHYASLLGIFAFVFIVCGVCGSLFTVLNSTSEYEKKEIAQGQFGDISFWLTKIGDEEEVELLQEIKALEKVEFVNSQKLIMANYEVHHTESDSEGCFLVDDGRYRKWGNRNEELGIEEGTCLVPLSFMEIYEHCGIGEKIDVVVGRNGLVKSLNIAGFFEDPFMGSSMVGMKSILISGKDFEEMKMMAEDSGIDALARSGILLHVQEKSDGTDSDNFNLYLNENSSLSKYTEDVHTTDTMVNFMLLLSNSFGAMFGAFAIVLFFVTAFILGNSVKSAVKTENRNFGIYKELGYTSKMLALNFCGLFMIPVLLGEIAGFAVSPVFSKLILQMQSTTTSLLVPVSVPVLLSLGFVILLFVILACFVYVEAGGIKKISPLESIKDLENREEFKRNGGFHKNGILFWIALRQIVSRKRNYLSALIVSFLLVLFATLAGRLNSWLGPNGEGLMDAFNPTDMHLGVQSFGNETMEDFEAIIKEYSEITEHYVLGMPTLRMNGKDYTANVTDAPELFHIFDGKTCTEENEIVITEFLMKDLGLKIGDTVTIGSRYVRGEDFTIVGTYQCANDVGENFGMTKEGYFRIGRDNPSLWCHHYFLKDESKKLEIMKVLEDTYGSDIHVHENSWPGLYGILRAMKMLICFMYVVSGLFILISIVLSSRKILNEEKADLNNYRLLGFSYSALRISFAIRFLIVAIIGSAAALILGALFSDPLINILMRSAGIAGFVSHPGFWWVVLPALIITLMFVFFAWFFGRKIRQR